MKPTTMPSVSGIEMLWMTVMANHIQGQIWPKFPKFILWLKKTPENINQETDSTGNRTSGLLGTEWRFQFFLVRDNYIIAIDAKWNFCCYFIWMDKQLLSAGTVGVRRWLKLVLDDCEDQMVLGDIHLKLRENSWTYFKKETGPTGSWTRACLWEAAMLPSLQQQLLDQFVKKNKQNQIFMN